MTQNVIHFVLTTITFNTLNAGTLDLLHQESLAGWITPDKTMTKKRLKGDVYFLSR